MKYIYISRETNAINYFYITTPKTQTDIKISIYRKATCTDIIIAYTHPTEHKYAAVRILYNRLDNYQLHTAEYQHEETKESVPMQKPGL